MKQLKGKSQLPQKGVSMYGLVIIVGGVVFLLVPVKALAHRHSAYSNEPGVAVERATWMENIEDERL